MEFEKSSPKLGRRVLVDAKESSKSGRFLRTLTRAFMSKDVSETTRQRTLQAEELERRYNEEVRLRKEAEKALVREKNELAITKVSLAMEGKLENELRKLEKELRLRRETEVQLKTRLATLEDIDIDRLLLQAKALAQKHERLRKDTDVLLAIQQERIDKLKTRLETLENEHKDMKEKAGEFEGKYIDELNVKKALMKEHQELVEAYNRDVDIDAYKVREERDNALMLIEEITTKQNTQPPSSFICPISQEVMKDPQITADGYTYEAEVIKKWLNAGHNTSPMTNLKLSHRHLVPNRALQSAIRESGFLD